MMKYIFRFILGCLISVPAFGQMETLKDVPVLLRRLSTSNSDTSRIVLKNSLAEAYRSANPDTAMILANEALQQAIKIDFHKGVIHACLALSVLYRERGDLAIGLEKGLQALKLSRKDNYHYGELLSDIRIANVYIAINDSRQTINYLADADSLLKKFPDYFMWAAVRIFMSDAYDQMNKLDSADLQVKQLEKDFSSHPNLLVKYHIERLKGNIAAKRNELSQAIEYYRQGNLVAIVQQQYRDAATICNSMASVFLKANQPDSAIFYAKEGLKYGEMLDYKTRILAASNLLGQLYEEKDPKEAIRFYKIASDAEDSLYGVKKIRELQFEAVKDRQRQAETEASKLAYSNRVKQLSFLGGAILFLLIIIVLFKNNRQKQKAKQNIELAYNKLKSTQAQLIQSEKMASLGELTAGIAHEIQNPLNFVNNFSEVNTELICELEDEAEKGNLDEIKLLAKDIKDNEEKINHHGKRAGDIVKGMLQHSQSSTGKKERTDINALCDEYLLLSYHGLRAKDKTFNATMKTNFDESLGKINIIPQDIGRVLLNLYNNAFYAVNEKLKAQGSQLTANYQPTVSVSTKKIDNHVIITVSDNGSGIPQNIVDKIFQPFFTTKPTGQGTGLGLSLSYDIIKAHGGEIFARAVSCGESRGKAETKENQGTTFTIQIPLL